MTQCIHICVGAYSDAYYTNGELRKVSKLRSPMQTLIQPWLKEVNDTTIMKPVAFLSTHLCQRISLVNVFMKTRN